MKNGSEIKKEPLIHISKRTNMGTGKALLVRCAAVLCALILSGLVAFVLIDKLNANPGRIGDFYACFIEGSFATSGMTWKFFKNVAVLLCIALALTPAYRMHFWNTGAEGQVLVGALGAISMAWYIGDALPNWLLLIIMFCAAVVAGIIWCLLPAICKAFFNTNETLFTLMMNYVASFLVSFFLLKWVPSGNALGVVNQNSHQGWLPTIIHNYFLIIVAVLVLTGIIYAYLNYSKHGYEISVVGESVATAKYIGINVKKVIIRTMILSGALCGFVGFLLASGLDHSITADAVGGLGFTAIMVAWLGKFNPLAMIGTSGLIIILDMGSQQIAETFDVRGAMPDIIVGIILFFVIGCEFFLNYHVHIRKKKNSNDTAVSANKEAKS